MNPLMLHQALEQALFSMNMGGVATSAPTDSIRRLPDGSVELNTREDGLHDVLGDLVPGSPFERLLMRSMNENRGALDPTFGGMAGPGGPVDPGGPTRVKRHPRPTFPPINFPL